MTNLTFDNPKEFLDHLKKRTTQGSLSQSESLSLLSASITALDNVLEGNRLFTAKLVQAVDCLNTAHNTWGHMLSELYKVLDCGQVSPEEMNEILAREICGVEIDKSS